MEESEIIKEINRLSKYRQKGRYPDLFKDYQKDMSYKLAIHSAWWSGNRLEDLTKADILTHVQKLNPDEKKSTIYPKIDNLVEEGILEKTKFGRYRRTHCTATDQEVPAFFIKNGNFSGFFSLPLNPCEYLHYYGLKTKDKNSNYMLPLEDIILEFKELGEAIGGAVENFMKKTGEIPRVITYTNFGWPQQLPYIVGQLRFEIYSLIHKNKNMTEDKFEILKSGLFEKIKSPPSEIFRDALVNWYNREKSALRKCLKVVNKLSENPEELHNYFLLINKIFDLISENKKSFDPKEILNSINNKIKMIDREISLLERDEYLLGLAARVKIFPKEELDKIIKREAKSVYRQFTAKE